MEDNIGYFDLRNVTVIDHVDEEALKDMPVPSVAFLVASASMEQEIECLLKLNPLINIVVYTLDFVVAGNMCSLLERYGIKEAEVIQIAVSKLGPKMPLTCSLRRGSSPAKRKQKYLIRAELRLRSWQ